MNRRLLRMSAVVLGGIVIGLVGSTALLDRSYATAVVRKAFTSSEPCPWRNLARLPVTNGQFSTLRQQYEGRVRLLSEDSQLALQRYASPTREFWIKKNGAYMDGRATLVYILAEEDWIMMNARGYEVHPGDVVVDVGAHIGTFGDDALRRGAAKVVMVEPDPVNLECIRRNFSAEIASGRVIVIPEGAWSSPGTLDFHVGVANSGTGSFVVPETDSKVISVRTRPLDDMLREVGIKTVNFIKMDIEGAEREALKGAANTLRTSRPRLMLDSYHLSDDPVVLPSLVHQASADYREYCAICAIERDNGSHVIPSAIFFSAGTI